MSRDTSPYIRRASIRAKRLERKLAGVDSLPEDDGLPSSQEDGETPADPSPGHAKAAAVSSR